MPEFPKLSLIIGGIASGKSKVAERLIATAKRAPVYIATAQPFDAEMTDKIAQHQVRRGIEWRTIEAPLDLVAALAKARSDEVILVDCLTLWLSNNMLKNIDVSREIQILTKALEEQSIPVVMVTNEVGCGGIAENALARRFQREQGHLNQQIAKISDLVVTVMAGLPHALKGVLPEGIK